MADLSTKYLGLTLRNPIIAGSSGMTNSLKEIVELEKSGVGAVVLKSIFEEQILLEADYRIRQAQTDEMTYADFSETLDYIDLHIKEKELSGYLNLIHSAKNNVDIPIIASINAVTTHEWTSFARTIEEAGADALELNIFVMPFSLEKECADNEKAYYEILKKVKSQVKIPVSVKISPFFSNLGKVIKNLEKFGADGVVLFNRFSNPDIDIENLKVTHADILSHSSDVANTLRWIAIMAKRVKMSLGASTGVHDGATVIKQLLAGADIVQVVSALYEYGPSYVLEMTKFLNDWMERKGFNYVDQFRGKLSQQTSENPDVYERMQFMKYFGDIK
ncbi:MAG: dihydroorotate dehydrogenase-like protein [Bacteroidales bacterium]|nr:dihydroorotate dehydrogenase-like protein [Bacteroidales bacterium]